MPGTGFLIPRKLSRKATTLRGRSNGHFLVAQSILSTQNASRFLCLQFRAEAEVTLYHDLAILEMLTLRALTNRNQPYKQSLVGGLISLLSCLLCGLCCCHGYFSCHDSSLNSLCNIWKNSPPPPNF